MKSYNVHVISNKILDQRLVCLVETSLVTFQELHLRGVAREVGPAIMPTVTRISRWWSYAIFNLHRKIDSVRFDLESRNNAMELY